MGSWVSTMGTLRTQANAKHRNRPRIMSVAGFASRTGRTIDVTIITCSTYLLNESSGLKAHRTLAPANARYPKRHLMLGGKVSLDQFPATRTSEIAANAGQKILFSRRGAMTISSAFATVVAVIRPVVRYTINGCTIST